MRLYLSREVSHSEVPKNILCVLVCMSLNSSTRATGNNNGSLMLDAVDTVICTPDVGWGNHPKHVEQFIDKINCV